MFCFSLFRERTVRWESGKPAFWFSTFPSAIAVDLSGMWESRSDFQGRWEAGCAFHQSVISTGSGPLRRKAFSVESMVSEDDWRLRNAKPHLYGAAFRWKTYLQRSTRGDHDHCAGCMVKFAEDRADGVLTEGYAVTADYKHGEDYEWVCADCFAALGEQLHWRCVGS